MRTAHRREALRVGDVAKAAGLTVEGVRYYERQGLLDRPARSQASYRLYPPEALVRLQFIRQAKAMGLSLAEIPAISAGKAVAATHGCNQCNGDTEGDGANITDYGEPRELRERSSGVPRYPGAMCSRFALFAGPEELATSSSVTGQR